MATPKFFHDQALLSGELVVLSEGESHHAVSVRRLHEGDSVILINGKGVKANAVIDVIRKRQVSVRINEVEIVASPDFEITIAAAVPKGDRSKTMLDMLTQLGVKAFIPLQCEFSVSKINDKHMDKWQRGIIEACKQSENPFIPELRSLMTPQQAVESVTQSDMLTYYADQEGVSVPQIAHSNALIMIGPEGGFSANEMQYFQNKGVTAVKLGSHILRTETAAISAAAVFVAAQ